MCLYRWVENKTVADKLSNIWANMQQIVKFWEKLPKSKWPLSKSYETVLSAVGDPFMKPKLAFFNFLARLIEPYLRKYQSDQSMLPYMFKDLKSSVKSVLSIIVQSDALENCKTAKQLINLNLNNEAVLLARKDIELGYGVKYELSQLRLKDMALAEQIFGFIKETQSATKILLENLLEQTPLSSDIVRCACMFEPEVLQTLSSSSLLQRMKSLLVHLMKCNILSPTECDKVTAEFRNFLADDLKKEQLKFQEFNPESKQLDDFFFHDIDISK